MPTYASVSVGDVLPAADFPVTRLDLVRYCGASGDFNIIHWNDRTATAVGLPGVIAHGMFTMAEAGRVVTDWIGDIGLLKEYGVRFTRPVPVPDDDQGTVVTVTATVAEKRDDSTVKIDLKASCGGDSVLGRAYAIVRLP